MARQRGIGHNPTLDNIYQTNNQNNLYDMAQNSDRYNNYSGTQAWPEYNPNLFAGVGRFDPRNLMRPDNLSQDMGASNAPLPVAQTPQLNTLDPNWQHQLRMQKLPPRGNIDNSWMSNLKDKFSGITTPLMALLKSQKNNPEEVFGLKNFPTYDGRVAYHPNDSLYAGMNVATGFGKGLSGAGQKRIDRIQNTVDNFADQWSNLASSEDPADKAAYAKKLRFHQEKLAKFKDEQAAYQADLALQTGEGGTKVDPPAATGTTTYGGPPASGWNQAQHIKSGGGHYKGAGTSGSYRAGPQGGAGYGPWSKRDGGRIGYQAGELVDEDINIQGPGFDVNENMEMSEGPSPFEMRIQELVDEGLSWQEAYQIAAKEFGQIAEGPEDSFSEEGIASLV
jgi:hypothetical protein